MFSTRWIVPTILWCLVTATWSATVGAQQQPLVPSETEDIPFHLVRMYAKTARATAWEAIERVTQRPFTTP